MSTALRSRSCVRSPRGMAEIPGCVVTQARKLAVHGWRHSGHYSNLVGTGIDCPSAVPKVSQFRPNLCLAPKRRHKDIGHRGSNNKQSQARRQTALEFLVEAWLGFEPRGPEATRAKRRSTRDQWRVARPEGFEPPTNGFGRNKGTHSDVAKVHLNALKTMRCKSTGIFRIAYLHALAHLTESECNLQNVTFSSNRHPGTRIPGQVSGAFRSLRNT